MVWSGPYFQGGKGLILGGNHFRHFTTPYIDVESINSPRMRNVSIKKDKFRWVYISRRVSKERKPSFLSFLLSVPFLFQFLLLLLSLPQRFILLSFLIIFLAHPRPYLSPSLSPPPLSLPSVEFSFYLQSVVGPSTKRVTLLLVLFALANSRLGVKSAGKFWAGASDGQACPLPFCTHFWEPEMCAAG